MKWVLTPDEFSYVWQNETDLDRLTAELVRVIQETMQPEHVSVWLREVKRETPDTKYEIRNTSEEPTS